MPDHSAEDEAIDAWCETLSRLRGRDVTVVERPDRERPGRGGCDAIAEVGGAPVAVEHTALDSYEDQRGDRDRFRRVVVPLEAEISRRFSDSWIEVWVPAGAVPIGGARSALIELLLLRVSEAVSGMPIAEASDLRLESFEWPDIPFGVSISRQALAGFEPACVVGRFRPPDVAGQLKGQLVRALCNKATTLKPYKLQMPTVLLLDIDSGYYQGVAETLGPALVEAEIGDIVDDVYLVSRRLRPWVLPVKIGQNVYPKLPEFNVFRRDQYEATYGRPATW